MNTSSISRIGGAAWTGLLVTVVTVLIWAWAAGETRDRQTFTPRLTFITPDPAGWTVSPRREVIVKLIAEGSTLARQSLEKLLKSPVEIAVAPRTGEQILDVADALSRHAALEQTGVHVLSADPPTFTVVVDQLERVQAPIRVVGLTGVQIEGNVKLEPATATIVMPSRVRGRNPNPAVEAILPEGLNLDPGVPQTVTARLQIPEPLRAAGTEFAESLGVNDPAREAKVIFTVRSRIESYLLKTVRVQIAGPWENHRDFVIQVPNEALVLEQVEVAGDADLMRRIRNEEVKVVALVHLAWEEAEKRSREVDADKRIERKRASFVAVMPDGSLQPINGRVSSTTGPPVIPLRIDPRNP